MSLTSQQQSEWMKLRGDMEQQFIELFRAAKLQGTLAELKAQVFRSRKQLDGVTQLFLRDLYEKWYSRFCALSPNFPRPCMDDLYCTAAIQAFNKVQEER